MILVNNLKRSQSVRRRALLAHFGRALTGQQDRLRSISQVGRGFQQGSAYFGVKPIQVAKIVGSEGRSADFNRNFLAHRWTRVDAAFDSDTPLPAIKVLEVDGHYFVRDGSHRVSVAKVRRMEYLDAEIIRLS